MSIFNKGNKKSDKAGASNRTEMIGYGDINSLLWYFSLPAIVGLLANASYNIINRIFVGHAVGGVAIAAIAIIFPVMIVFMGMSMLIGIGATTLISIRLGQQKKHEADVIMGNALTFLFLLPLISCIGLYMYIEPLLILIGATENVLPYAVDYLKIFLPGMVIMSVSLGMNNVIRAEGSPRIAMLTQILGGAVNVLFNYIFVMQFGWGVKGAAAGVVLGQIFSLIWVMSYFLYPDRSYLKLKLANLTPRLDYLRSIVVIGFAPFIMQITASVQQLILNRSLVFHGGDSALATVGIIGSLSMLLVMPLVGLNQGAQPIIGYNYGAHRYDRVRKTLQQAVIYATVFSVFSWIIIQLFPRYLVGVFMSNEPETTLMAAHALVVFFAVLMTVGFQVICSGYFQAIGKPFQATVLSLTRQVLFYIPLLLVLPRFWQLEGIWRATPFSDLAAFLITGIWIFFELRNTSMLSAKDAQVKTELALTAQPNSIP